MQCASKPMTLRYRVLSAVLDMPGWYCGNCPESVHTCKDMQESDRQLSLLKARAENVLLPSDHLEQRAGYGDKFEQALAKVPATPPDANDALRSNEYP